VAIVDRDSPAAGADPGAATSAYRSGIVASRPGTITVADVVVDHDVKFTAVSVYAPWERPPSKDDIFADASVHRLLSDLAALTWPRWHRVVVAGDLNIVHGYGEDRDPYWARLHATVFERAAAMRLSFVGPQFPNGRQQLDPWPEELPRESLNVPTFHTRDQTPTSATRQLDFVFVSEGLRDLVTVTARNDPAEWEPSDHCQIVIDVDV
jgi:exonuclease III